jgi:hypothetical protein
VFENKSPTLAPTSGELTSTLELMASFSNQVEASSATKMVLLITGDSGSEILSPSKKNYTELEKVLYAVLMASRKLRHYFQAYHIIIPSSQPLKNIMRNREATGRIGKWAAELNEFTIDYVHRSSIQSQALTNFIADWTPGLTKKK